MMSQESKQNRSTSDSDWGRHIDAIRTALGLNYDYPSDSMDADRACPATHAAFVTLDMLYLELKHTNEVITDLRAASVEQEKVIERLREALNPFAVIGKAIAENAKSEAWLEHPLFFAGTDEDPQKWTITGRGFDNAAKIFNATAKGNG